MQNKFIKYASYLIGIAVVCLLCFGLYSCSPEKKLERLLRKYPQLIKTDTVYVKRTFTVPEFMNDTIIQLDTTTSGLFEIVDSLAAILDSVQRYGLKKEIKQYIINRPVIKDTFNIPLRNGGWVKVYQVGTHLEHKLHEPPLVLEAKVPVSTTTIVYKDIPWRLAWYWVLIAIVCGIAIGGYLFNKKIQS